MRSLHALLGATALIAAFVFLGCGKTVIDSAKTEDALEANLTKSLETKVSSVDCPSDVEVEARATFECTVDFKDGETQTATLEILNDEADVRVTELSGANE